MPGKRKDWKKLLLKQTIIDKEAILITDIDKTHLVSRTIIHFTCKCGITDKRKLRYIIFGEGKTKKTGLYCKKCSYSKGSIQRKSTYLKNYGVENISQLNEIKEKKKGTCKKNHNYEYSFHSEKLREIREKTWIKNYGVTHPSKSDKIKKQKIITCLKNFGVTNPMKNKEIQQKSKETCLKIYGNEYYFVSDHYYNNIKDYTKKAEQTSLERYGVKNVLINKIQWRTQNKYYN